MTDYNYSSPVAQLLTLGEPDPADWLDYASLGIQTEHIQEKQLRKKNRKKKK